MSREKRSIHKEIDFVARFIEVCGTSRPAEIQRSLNITYQAAKNYLNGRFPSAEILLRLAETTDYSLHWLLTGVGEKRVRAKMLDTPLPTDEMRKFVREVCAEMIDERLAGRETYAKLVELDSGDLIAETVRETAVAEK